MQVLHFGAGNIGRGFIGQILKANNYDLTFVDVNEKIIKTLQEQNKYTIKILNKQQDEILIEDIQGINSLQEADKVIDLIAQVDLITTSLGQDNLKYIVDILVQGLSLRKEQNKLNKLDIIACENGVKVSSIFKELVADKLNLNEEYFVENIAFVDSAVDRIVPNQVNKNLLDVQVEEDFEWVVDKTQIKQNFALSHVVYTENLLFYNKRKLLTVNFAHAYIGYMGYQKGYTYVSEALKDEMIYQNVKVALVDIKNALKYDFAFEEAEQDLYIDKTIKRFQNELIVDELTRVARNPKTKLAKEERFIAPLLKLVANNQEADGIIKGVAYALKYNYTEDKQAQEIQALIDKKGINLAISELTSITEDELINKIKKIYQTI